MRDQSNGEGWLIFAGIVLMTAGVMRFFDAIWAWTYNGPYYPITCNRRCWAAA